MIDLSNYERILIVADVHADATFLKKVIKTARDHICDAIFQLGDFGYWPTHNANFPKASPYMPIYFIDGNHEEHPKLNQNEEYTEIVPNVYHISRGTYLKIGNMDCVAIGGAFSIDRPHRIEGHSWYHEEEISNYDVDKCLIHKEFVPMDIIFSHDCPFSVNVVSNNHLLAIPTRERLDIIKDKLDPRYWFFGHYHVDFKKYQEGTEFHGLPSNLEGYIRTVVFDCKMGKIESEPTIDHLISSSFFSNERK